MSDIERLQSENKTLFDEHRIAMRLLRENTATLEAVAAERDALRIQVERKTPSVEALTELVWSVDGPRYDGWPNIGERVYWGYHKQYPGDYNRCRKIAAAVLATFSSDERT